MTFVVVTKVILHMDREILINYGIVFSRMLSCMRM